MQVSVLFQPAFPHAFVEVPAGKSVPVFSGRLGEGYFLVARRLHGADDRSVRTESDGVLFRLRVGQTGIFRIDVRIFRQRRMQVSVLFQPALPHAFVEVPAGKGMPLFARRGGKGYLFVARRLHGADDRSVRAESDGVLFRLRVGVGIGVRIRRFLRRIARIGGQIFRERFRRERI